MEPITTDELHEALRAALFHPSATETLVMAIRIEEYKTVSMLTMLEKVPRTYCVVRSKLDGSFLLRRIKLDKNREFVFAKAFALEAVQKVTRLNPNEFGAMLFVSFLEGKRYVWDCGELGALENFLQTLTTVAFLKPSEADVVFEKGEPVASVQEPQEPALLPTKKAPVEAELSIDELFKTDEALNVESLDIELLEVKWKAMLNEIDSKNAAYLVGLGDKTASLTNTLDECIKTMEAVDESFGVTFLRVKSLEKDVNFLQTFNDALHIQTINQRSLFQVLFELIDSLTIGKSLTSTLLQADLKSIDDIKKMQHAMDTILAKMVAHSQLAELDGLAAVQEQKKNFAQAVSTIGERLLQFFRKYFKEQADLLLADKSRFPKREKHVSLIGHDNFFNSSYVYNRILSNLFALDPKRHLEIVNCYCECLFPVYKKEFEEFTTVIVEEHLLKKQNASVTFDSKKSATLANYPVTKDALLGGQKFSPHLLLDYFLKTMVPICVQEKIAIQRIFYHKIDQSELLSARWFEKLIEIVAATLEPTAPIFYRADNSYLVKMIFSLERSFSFLTGNNIAQYACLEKLIKIMADLQYSFINEQLGHLEEQRVQLMKSKKPPLILPYITTFCEFVTAIQNIFRTSTTATSPTIQPASLSPIVGNAMENFADSMSRKVASESILKLFTFIMKSLKMFEGERCEAILKNVYFLNLQLRPKENAKFTTGIDLYELLVLPRIQEELDKYSRIMSDSIISQSIPVPYEYFAKLGDAFRYFDPEEICFNPNFTLRTTCAILEGFKNESAITQRIYFTRDEVYRRFVDKNIQTVVLERVKDEFTKRINIWNSLLETVYPGNELQIPLYTLQVVGRLN